MLVFAKVSNLSQLSLIMMAIIRRNDGLRIVFMIKIVHLPMWIFKMCIWATITNFDRSVGKFLAIIVRLTIIRIFRIWYKKCASCRFE